MSDHDSHDYSSHIKTYFLIGGVLLIFTCVTWAIAFFDLGEPGIDIVDLVVGLGIAAFKASLVALIFMHLSNEKKIIYKFLVFTFAFALALAGLTLFAELDPLTFDGFFKSKP